MYGRVPWYQDCSRFNIDYYDRACDSTYRIKYSARLLLIELYYCTVDAVSNVDAVFFSFPPGVFSARCLQIERLKKLVGRKGFSNNPAQEISDVMKLFEGDMAGLQKDIASLQR